MAVDAGGGAYFLSHRVSYQEIYTVVESSDGEKKGFAEPLTQWIEVRVGHGGLTLFALAHPIARERRGGVIVDGGHGRRTIDIIP